jgi:hypothetical protein
MKRRFSMGWLLLVLWVLSACSSPVSPDENQAPFSITFELMTEPVISVPYTGYYPSIYTAFDLFKTALEDQGIPLVYSESEFGIFIEEVATLQPPYGAYIMIRQNDVPLEVGLADAPFKTGDTFTFELEYWDQASKQRHDALDAFLETEADVYIGAKSYEVFTALSYLDALEFETYNPQTQTQADLIRSILILRSLDQDVTVLQTELAEVYSTELTFSAGLGLLALMGSEGYESAKLAFINSLTSLDLNTGWLDDLSMAIIALDESTPEDLVEAFKSRIFDDLNAPSIAHVIMAMVVLGEDPYQHLDENGISLVDHLLSFQNDSGGFVYNSDSSPMDTRQFSSPQSFLALVVLDQSISQPPRLPYRP